MIIQNRNHNFNFKKIKTQNKYIVCSICIEMNMLENKEVTKVLTRLVKYQKCHLFGVRMHNTTYLIKQFLYKNFFSTMLEYIEI